MKVILKKLKLSQSEGRYSWLVPLFLENGSKDFLETWHEVRDQKSKQSDRAGFFERNRNFFL